MGIYKKKILKFQKKRDKIVTVKNLTFQKKRGTNQ